MYGKNTPSPLRRNRVKKTLIKTLQGAILTETEFYTIFTNIEECINSRSLVKLSENADNENLSCITPSHLIIGKTLRPIPSVIYQQIELPRQNLGSGKRWKIRHKLANYLGIDGQRNICLN